jgi:phosphoribosyl 1,2-cyclic phosphodiesterase
VIDVTFHGVRGSTPCSGDSVRRYGGNTSCVSLQRDGEPPIVLDLGTGLRDFGHTLAPDGAFEGAVLLTHLHWDHVQGLPFFVPILRDGSTLSVFAPVQEDGRSVREAFDCFLRPPYFPISLEHVPGDLAFEEVHEERFAVQDAKVLSRLVPHVGNTNGYRVEWGGLSVAYIPDHQQPADPHVGVSDGALALCDGADLVIHDAQYTLDEFEVKKTWGHCTVEYAIRVAYEAGAKRLALFHHDPVRSDDELDALARCMGALGDRLGVEVFVAAEGMNVALGD